jgi:hypothetical protein
VTLVDDPIVSKQQDLQAAKQAIAGPVPLLPESPDTSVSLALGLYHGGEYHPTAEVRELTGADEEKLAKVKDEIASFSTVIALGTTRIGSIDLESKTLQERKGLLGGLLMGDRDKLFLNIVRVTFGDTRNVGFNCMHCGEGQEVDLLLSEDFPQSDGDTSARVFSYTTNRGDTVEYRLATGDDQEEVLDKPISQAESNTLMLSRCITKVNGELAVDPLGFARALGMKDRADLLNELASKQPSISLEVKTTCVACGEEVPLSVSWGTIFRP